MQKAALWVRVISFLFPIIGLVLYIVWRQNERTRANSVGRAAIWGFVVSFILRIIAAALAT